MRALPGFDLASPALSGPWVAQGTCLGVDVPEGTISFYDRSLPVRSGDLALLFGVSPGGPYGDSAFLQKHVIEAGGGWYLTCREATLPLAPHRPMGRCVLQIQFPADWPRPEFDREYPAPSLELRRTLARKARRVLERVGRDGIDLSPTIYDPMNDDSRARSFPAEIRVLLGDVLGARSAGLIALAEQVHGARCNPPAWAFRIMVETAAQTAIAEQARLARLMESLADQYRLACALK